MKQINVQDESTVQYGRSPKKRKMNSSDSHSGNIESELLTSLELREKALTEREVKVTQKEEELKQKEGGLNEREKMILTSLQSLKEQTRKLQVKAIELHNREEALKQKELVLKEKELAQEKRTNKENEEIIQEGIGKNAISYRRYLQSYLLKELLSALRKDISRIHSSEQDKKYFKFVSFLEKGLGQLNDFQLNSRKVSTSLPSSARAIQQEYALVFIFTAILRYKDKEPRPIWIGDFIYYFKINVQNRINGTAKKLHNTFRNICETMQLTQLDEFKVIIKKQEDILIDLLEYQQDKKKYDVPEAAQLLEERKQFVDIFGKKEKVNKFKEVFIETYNAPTENENSVSASSSDSPLSSIRDNSPSEELPPIGGNISSDLPPPRYSSIIPLLSTGFLPPPVKSTLPRREVEGQSKFPTYNENSSDVMQGTVLLARPRK